MSPTLLMFIMGPGGSHSLEEGWEAPLRTLCASGTVMGQGPRCPKDVEEQDGH